MTLTKSEAFELLAENVALLEVDMRSGKITFASRPLEAMFGYSIPGDLEGKTVEALVSEAVREVHASVHRPAFTAHPEPRLLGSKSRLTGRHHDGTLFPVEIMLLPRAVNLVRVVLVVVLDMRDRVTFPPAIPVAEVAKEP